jgi:hypothetical protein
LFACKCLLKPALCQAIQYRYTRYNLPFDFAVSQPAIGSYKLEKLHHLFVLKMKSNKNSSFDNSPPSQHEGQGFVGFNTTKKFVMNVTDTSEDQYQQKLDNVYEGGKAKAKDILP